MYQNLVLYCSVWAPEFVNFVHIITPNLLPCSRRNTYNDEKVLNLCFLIG